MNHANKCISNDVQLCPQHMAVLKKPGEQVISANVDHLQIAEFPDQRNPFLEILIRELRPLVAKCEAYYRSEANSRLSPCIIPHKLFTDHNT